MGNSSFTTKIDGWQFGFQMERQTTLKIKGLNIALLNSSLNSSQTMMTKYDAEYNNLSLPQNIYNKCKTIVKLFNVLKDFQQQLKLVNDSLVIKSCGIELLLISRVSEDQCILQGKQTLQHDMIPVPLQKMNETPYKCVVLIEAYFSDNGSMLTSGFFIGKNTILTVAHAFCIRKYDKYSEAYLAKIYFYKDGNLQSVLVEKHYFLNQYRICAQDDMQKYDFAIVVLKENSSVTQDMILQVQWNSPIKDQTVEIIGYSQDLDKTFSKNKHPFHMKCKIYFKSLYKVKYPKNTKAGISGGPVIIYNETQKNFKAIGIHRGIDASLGFGLLFNSSGKNQFQVFNELFTNSSSQKMISELNHSKLQLKDKLQKLQSQLIDNQIVLEQIKEKQKETVQKVTQLQIKLSKQKSQKEQTQNNLKKSQQEQKKLQIQYQKISKQLQKYKNQEIERQRIKNQEVQRKKKQQENSRIRSTNGKTGRARQLEQIGKQLFHSDIDQSIQNWLKCFVLIEQIYTKQSNQYLEILHLLGQAYSKKKSVPKCIEYYEAYIEIAFSVKGEYNVDYLSANYNLGTHYYVLRQDEKALRCFKAIQKAFTFNQMKEDPEVKQYIQNYKNIILFCLGDLHRRRKQQKQYKRCLEYFKKLLELVEKNQSSTIANTMMTQIGVTYFILNDTDNKDQYFLYRKNRRIKQIKQENYSPQDQLIIREAAFLYAEGQYDLSLQKINTLTTPFYISYQRQMVNVIQIIKGQRISRQYYS